jgi:hypothetical protein
MARGLNFELGGQVCSAAITKLDRDKLYGKVATHYYDRDGKECYFGYVSEDGTMIFGREAFQSGYVNSQGQWIERSELKMVDLEKRPLEKKESSLNQTIVLDKKVSIDEYLGYVANSVYQLDAPAELLSAVENETAIFTFNFNYMASYHTNQAFLIANEGQVFMVVAQPDGFDFIGQQEIQSPLIGDDEDEEEDNDDDIDFSMF